MNVIYKGIDSRFHRILHVIDSLNDQLKQGEQEKFRVTLAVLLLKMVAYFQDEEDQLEKLSLPNHLEHCEHHRSICSIAARIVHNDNLSNHAYDLSLLRSTWLDHMQTFDSDY